MRIALPLAAIVFVLAACSSSTSSSSSSSSSSSGGGGGCPPYQGEVVQGDPGSACDSAGDCKAPTCFCVDGTKGTGPRACVSSRCDGAQSCTTFCAAHGGAGPCRDGG